jgi:hypothetical protein
MAARLNAGSVYADHLSGRNTLGGHKSARDSRAAGTERTCDLPARRDRVQPIIGRLLGAEPVLA